MSAVIASVPAAIQHADGCGTQSHRWAGLPGNGGVLSLSAFQTLSLRPCSEANSVFGGGMGLQCLLEFPLLPMLVLG